MAKNNCNPQQQSRRAARIFRGGSEACKKNSLIRILAYFTRAGADFPRARAPALVDLLSRLRLFVLQARKSTRHAPAK